MVPGTRSRSVRSSTAGSADGAGIAPGTGSGMRRQGSGTASSTRTSAPGCGLPMPGSTAGPERSRWSTSFPAGDSSATNAALSSPASASALCTRFTAANSSCMPSNRAARPGGGGLRRNGTLQAYRPICPPTRPSGAESRSALPARRSLNSGSQVAKSCSEDNGGLRSFP